MSESDATIRTGAASTAPLNALEAIQRACQGVAMYGRNHPAVHAAVESSVAALKDSGGFRVLSRGVKHYVGESCLSDIAGLETICKRLGDLRIASLVFTSHVGVADVESMIAAWGSIPVDRRWAATDADALSKSTGGRIECVPTTYGNLRVQEGSSQNAEIEIDWSTIGSDLLRVASGSGGVTATELASRINSNLDAQLGGIPTEVLESAAEAISKATPEERAAAEARLTLFFSSLSGDIRNASIRVDVARPERSIHVLEELVGPLPVSSVITNIEQLDSAVLSSGNGLRLLAKVIWLSRDHDRLSGRIENILEELRPSLASLGGQAEEVTRAVDALQVAITAEEFTPEDYGNLINSLNQVQREPLRKRPAIKAWTTDSSRILAVSIAADLALDPETPTENLANAFSYIEQNVLTLAEAQAFDVLVEAGRAISAARERDLSPAVHEAIDRCAGMICSPQCASAIVVCAQKAGVSESDLSGIFASCGGRAVAALVQAIMAGKVAINPTELLNHPNLNMRELAAGLFKGDPGTLSTIAGLEGVEPERRARLAHAMLAHDSVEYRLIAYNAFYDLYSRWPTSLVAHALVEDDPRACQLGVNRLDRDPGNIRSVGVMLAGGLGFEPDSNLFDSGLLALEHRGADAVLRQLSATLLKKPTPGRVARAARAMFASKRCVRKCA